MLEQLQPDSYTKVDLVKTRRGFVMIESLGPDQDGKDTWKVYCFRHTGKLNEGTWGSFEIASRHESLDEHQVFSVLTDEDPFIQGQKPAWERSACGQ